MQSHAHLRGRLAPRLKYAKGYGMSQIGGTYLRSLYRRGGGIQYHDYGKNGSSEGVERGKAHDCQDYWQAGQT